jgi:hypothetical protein
MCIGGYCLDPGDGETGDGDGDSESGDGDGEPGDGDGDESQPKIVFVTSETYTGLLGGLTGADSKCQSLAETAGLPGIYMAWLSTDTASPSTRFTQSTKPYMLVNGTQIADDWADLTDGTLDNPIDTDEMGNTSPASDITCNSDMRVAYTATLADGTQDPMDYASGCEHWTIAQGVDVSVGRTTRSDAEWTEGCFGPYCIKHAALYCFQQ